MYCQWPLIFVYACILPYQWHFVGSTVQSTHLRDIVDKTPKKCDLLELLSEVKDKWFDIGEMLEVDNATLRSLHENNYSASRKLADTLQHWIDSASSPVTWGTIVEVLRTDYINLPRVADKIEDKLSTQLYNKYCHRPSNVNFPGIIIIIGIVAAGTTAEPVLTATATSTTTEGKSNVVVIYMSLPWQCIYSVLLTYSIIHRFQW